MSDETPEEMLERLQAMAAPGQGTWDLSERDQAAIAWAVEELEREPEEARRITRDVLQTTREDFARGVYPDLREGLEHAAGILLDLARGARGSRDEAVEVDHRVLLELVLDVLDVAKPEELDELIEELADDA